MKATQRPRRCDWPACPFPAHYTLAWDTMLAGYDTKVVQACERHIGQWREAWQQAKAGHEAGSKL